MVSKASKAQGSSPTQNLHSEKILKRKKTSRSISWKDQKEGRLKESTNYQTLEIAESMPFLADDKRKVQWRKRLRKWLSWVTKLVYTRDQTSAWVVGVASSFPSCHTASLIQLKNPVQGTTYIVI